MAGASFKQACPSCEAMVPIRDENLIGRKIDCPKCKYRFIVEEPAEEEEDDAPPAKKGAPAAKSGSKNGDKGGPSSKDGGKPGDKGGPKKKGDDSGKAPSKKKANNSNMLLIGGGLGLLGLVAIGVCGWMIFGGDGGSSSSSSPSKAMSSAGTPANEEPPPPVETPKPVAPALANVSNFLPNDTEAVVSYPMAVTMGSAIKTAAITEAEGGFRPERFNKVMSFSIDNVNRVVNAINSSQGWVFSILQTKTPYNRDAIKAQLALSARPAIKGKSGKMHELFQVKREFESLGNLLLKVNQPKDAFFVHFLDANTMVFADLAPLQKFLEADGQPELLTKDAPPPSAPSGSPGSGGSSTPPAPTGGVMAMKPGMAGSGGPPMAGGMGGMGSMGSMGSMGGMGGMSPPGSGGPAAGAPAPVVSSSWLSVNPALKLMLDRVEKQEENKTTLRKEPAYVVSVAGMMDPWNAPLLSVFNKQLVEQEIDFLQRTIIQQFLSTELKKINSMGVSLNSFDPRKADATVAVEFKDRREAENIDKQLRPLLPMVPPLAKSALGLVLSLPNAPANNQQGGMMGMGGMGGMGSMGGFSRPGGGGGGGATAGDGLGSPPPTGGSGMPGYPGGFPGMGGPGGTAGNTPQEKSDGKFLFSLEDRMIVSGFEVEMTSQAYEKVIGPMREAMQWVKAQADLATTHSHIHELGEALKNYVQEKGEFPPGALPRNPNAERGLPWRPDQRLSWVVALLPYLGEEFRDWKIDRDNEWNQGGNSFVATRIVPALVANRMPGTGPVLTSFPGQSEMPVASTHFVAISGLGLDSATYRMGDANTAKKLGIFGYDRVTKKNDVKDGLDKTIAFLMVPPEHKAPWLAGGGATVRPVLEADDTRGLSTAPGGEGKPIAPFVCITYPAKAQEKTKWDGKKGTIAIMADGRVRFIPEDLPAATFRALCTIAGGETIERIDSICPLIEHHEPEIAPPPAVATPSGTPTTPTSPANPGSPAPGADIPGLPAGWTTFRSQAGRFAIGAPGKMTERTINTAGFQVLMAVLETPDKKSFVITHQDIPKGLPVNDDLLFEGSKTGMLANVPGGKISDEKKLTVEGNPAREMNLAGEKGNARVRIIKAGERVFALLVGFPPGPVDEGVAKTFFESFRTVK